VTTHEEEVVDPFAIFDSPEGFIGNDNPGALNAAVDSALNSDEQFPDVPDAQDTHVTLPGGILIDGELITFAEVKELTGEDEEEIARALKNGNPQRFVDVLTRQSVVRIGDQKPDRKLLKRLLTGDRDMILLQTARVTFGETHEFEGIICPGCNESVDIEFELNEIPVRKVENATDTFKVNLRSGVAEVRFPVVSDYDKASENTSLTTKERDTLLLSQVVKSIDNIPVNGQKQPVLEMGVKDRKAILDYITNHMPGPRYDEIKITHEECGTEVPLPVGIFDLFQELVYSG
jgi:hypothetical protein